MERGYNRHCAIRFFAMILVFVLMSAGCSHTPATPAPKPVAVTVGKVESRIMPIQLEEVGNVQAYNSVTIMPLVTGQILNLHFQQGRNVQAGDLLITIDPAPFEQKLAQAEALLDYNIKQGMFTNATARRYDQLFQQGAVSKQDYEQMNTSSATQTATVQQSQAAVEAARIDLNNCYIRSPIDGRTGAFLANLGSLATANQTQLVVINQIEPVFVRFTIPEKYLASVVTAQKAGPLAVTAVITDQGLTITDGVLTFIDNTVDVASGVIEMKAQFSNTTRQLWPGQFIRVILKLGEQPNAVVVPVAAVMDGQQGKYVFVVKDDLKVEVRKVTVDREINGLTVVAQGLNPGETVVTDGQVNLRPGSTVSIKESPSQPAAVKQQGGGSQ